MESWYGSAQDICLTKDIVWKVPTYLLTHEWCKLRLNNKLIGLMKSCQDIMTESELGAHKYLESLGTIPVRFEDICKYGSLKLFKNLLLIESWVC